MKKLPIIEKFISIDGEGPMAGELATFIRFAGCNLRCSWCDTTYSWNKNEIKEYLTPLEIYEYIKANNINHITLTGGEPLIQAEINPLLELLSKDKNLLTHIETNGTVDIKPYKEAFGDINIHYIVDFKLPASGMSEKMFIGNLDIVSKKDVYKFVVASKEDLNKAYEIINKNELYNKCKVYISPVTEKISPEDIVNFMKIKKLQNVKLGLQLHKIIWNKNLRGV